MGGDLTEEYLEQLAREQQSEAWRKQHHESDRCGSCNHPAHGVTCSFTGIYTSCQCPSSMKWEQAS